MKLTTNKSKAALILFFTMITASAALHAEDDPGNTGMGTNQELEQNTPFLDQYRHRVQYDFGIGWAGGRQHIMTETGPAWLVNSLINAPSVGQSIAFPFNEGTENKYYPYRTELLYSYMDRFDFVYRRTTLNRKYNRNISPSVLFAYPGNDNFVTSLFEGTRLLRYRFDNRYYEFGYYHRWLENLRAGPVVAYHSYIEDLTASYGSYTVRNFSSIPDAGLETWAPGGEARLKYDMKGYAFGLGTKWDVLPYLRIKYNLYFINREGTLNGGGYQLIQTRTVNGDEALALNPLYQTGDVSEKGMLHRLEAEFRYCRLSATIGYEREDTKRSYDRYSYFQNQPRDVSLKSNILGIGETATESDSYRNELYLKLGMAVHFGDLATAPRRQPATTTTRPEPEPEPEPEPQVAEQVTEESSDYLNKVYNNVKEEFKSSGLALEEMENEFRALGFNMKKELDENGRTKELIATIDGDLSFATGSAKLTQKALQIVDQVGEGLAGNKNTVAKVHGHTDTPGRRAANLTLSFRRADAVRNALIERKGIERERIIEVEGFADDRKIVDTTAAEPKNRRTEIRIAYKN